MWQLTILDKRSTGPFKRRHDTYHDNTRHNAGNCDTLRDDGMRFTMQCVILKNVAMHIVVLANVAMLGVQAPK